MSIVCKNRDKQKENGFRHFRGFPESRKLNKKNIYLIFKQRSGGNKNIEPLGMEKKLMTIAGDVLGKCQGEFR